jgi:hypothetical protein
MLLAANYDLHACTNYSGLLDGRLRRVTSLASHKTDLTTVSGCHTNLTTISDSINQKAGGLLPTCEGI